MSYDTPSPREEESGAPDDKIPDDKITADGVPTDESLPQTAPSDPNATDTDSADAADQEGES